LTPQHGENGDVARFDRSKRARAPIAEKSLRIRLVGEEWWPFRQPAAAALRVTAADATDASAGPAFATALPDLPAFDLRIQLACTSPVS
jgi:hypothetical protein